MSLLFPLLLLHFHIAFSDFLSDHLTSNVNVTIDPCDNFYLHVCSQSIDESEFPLQRIYQFYVNISQKYKHISESYNLAILNDIATILQTTVENRAEFDHSKCADDDYCYQNEFDYFFKHYPNEVSDRLKYFVDHLDNQNKEKILEVITTVIDSINNNPQLDVAKIATGVRKFYQALTNRLFVMEELKERGIFGEVPNLDDDVKDFKEMIIEKFRNTPWMNERDEFGFSLLAEFEDKVNDLNVYYDLDKNDEDLILLRKINGDFLQNYYNAKKRSTGVEVLDIYFALFEADEALSRITDNDASGIIRIPINESILVSRVNEQLIPDAFYDDKNRVAILAPFIYPKLTDNTIFDKPYDLFQTIGHEIFHSVVRESWADRSVVFKDNMECYNDHFNRTCDSFGEESCNSGPQTFEEDGPDIEGLRVAHDWFSQFYNNEEMKEVIFKSDFFSVTREQAFFYLYGFFACQTIKPVEHHGDTHSYHQVRVNGDMTQLPEFTQAFSCNAEQKMYSTKEESCHLFGPDSK